MEIPKKYQGKLPKVEQMILMNLMESNPREFQKMELKNETMKYVIEKSEELESQYPETKNMEYMEGVQRAKWIQHTAWDLTMREILLPVPDSK